MLAGLASESIASASEDRSRRCARAGWDESGAVRACRGRMRPIGGWRGGPCCAASRLPRPACRTSLCWTALRWLPRVGKLRPVLILQATLAPGLCKNSLWTSALRTKNPSWDRPQCCAECSARPCSSLVYVERGSWTRASRAAAPGARAPALFLSAAPASLLGTQNAARRLETFFICNLISPLAPACAQVTPANCLCSHRGRHRRDRRPG